MTQTQNDAHENELTITGWLWRCAIAGYALGESEQNLPDWEQFLDVMAQAEKWCREAGICI